LSYLTGIFVDEPLDEEIIGFIQAYSSIIVSWNENLAKDDDIRIKAIALTRYCEGLFTLRETVHQGFTVKSTARTTPYPSGRSVTLTGIYMSMLRMATGRMLRYR
jgi:hypothetical protein